MGNVSDMREDVSPLKHARNEKQSESEQDLPEIRFEKACQEESNEIDGENYTRNKIATPRMARRVPAIACQPIFSLNTK